MAVIEEEPVQLKITDPTARMARFQLLSMLSAPQVIVSDAMDKWEIILPNYGTYLGEGRSRLLSACGDTFDEALDELWNRATKMPVVAIPERTYLHGVEVKTTPFRWAGSRWESITESTR